MTDILNFRLPAGWKETSLNNLIAAGSRITYGVVQPGEKVLHGIPLVRGGDVFDGQIFEQNLRTIAPAISEAYPHTVLKGGELLMSLVGYPGEVALVPPSLAGANIARQVACIRLNRHVDNRYLMYYLQSDLGKHYLAQKSTGSAQQVINLADLKDLTVVTATLPEQKKIASILETVDALIETTRQKIAKLKNLKTGVMQELFSRGIGQSSLKSSPVGSIPQNWGLSTLGQVSARLQTGPFGNQLHSQDYVETGVPVVMSRDIKDQLIQTGALARISQKKADSLERFKLRSGDILFSRRGDIGRTALVREENAGWICGTGCLKVTLNASLVPEYFIFYLTLTGVIDWLNNNGVGQTMLNLNTSILAKLPVVVPPVAEQQIIAATMASIDKVLIANEAKLRQLIHTKKSLMQDLLTGRVLTRIDGHD